MCAECEKPILAENPHWIAERNPEGTEPYVWSPALDFGQLGSAGLGCLWYFFDSQEACEEWLRENLADIPIPLGAPENVRRQREDFMSAWIERHELDSQTEAG